MIQKTETTTVQQVLGSPSGQYIGSHSITRRATVVKKTGPAYCPYPYLLGLAFFFSFLKARKNLKRKYPKAIPIIEIFQSILNGDINVLRRESIILRKTTWIKMIK